jgi:hypothetical protein
MRSITDLWGDLGELSEDETLHVLTKLFVVYEEEQQNKPDDEGVQKFFQNLDNIISQTRECNSNRR